MLLCHLWGGEDTGGGAEWKERCSGSRGKFQNLPTPRALCWLCLGDKPQVLSVTGVSAYNRPHPLPGPRAAVGKNELFLSISWLRFPFRCISNQEDRHG